MRKIPATMATQHPDHATIPFWHSKAFISTTDEAKELFISFSDLGITEYKWDWEGKLVDESVLERLFGEHFDFFKKHPLGIDRFLTFRLPNPKVQTEFRIGRAFMNVASGASVAKHFGLPTPPIFEAILPMTETAEEMFALQEAYVEMHSLKHPLFRLEGILTNLRIIPLFEQVTTIINSDSILKKYFSLYKNRFKKLPPYFRPYVARSDPALNAGIVPTVLAIKIALSRYKNLSKEIGIPFYPIIGAAVLPFRGGISPLTVEQFTKEYQGIRTTTIQSAFRYDFPKPTVIKAIADLERILPTAQAVSIFKKDEKKLINLIPQFESYYTKTIEGIAPLINTIAASFPKRRERVQHIGLFGYSRGVGKVTLPRAITFTGSLYSLGIPPELIGTGRGLRAAEKNGTLELIRKHYIFLKEDMIQAGKFLQKDVLNKLAKQTPYWKSVQEDIAQIEKIFAIELGPQTKEEKEHGKISLSLYKNLQKKLPIDVLIEQSALLRNSLG